MSPKIEAKINLSDVFKAIITVHEGYGMDGDEKKTKPRIINIDKFLYAEAEYKTEEDRDDLIKRNVDVSRLYFSTGDNSNGSVRTVETPEQIEALIQDAEDKRIKRIIKSRLGIGIF